VIAPDARQDFRHRQPEERACRFRELIGRGEISDTQALMTPCWLICKRDAILPRRRAPDTAPDAKVLDTTRLTEEAFAAALVIVAKQAD
jgi:hypothetical protein